MYSIQNMLRYAMVAAMVLLTTGCGGGGSELTGSSPTPAPVPNPVPSPNPTPVPTPTPGPMPTPVPDPVPVPVQPQGATVTNFKIVNKSASNQANVPFTFGQAFTPGTVPANTQFIGKLSNGTTVPLQTNVKATHADGTLRHAIFSGVLPALAANQTQVIDLVTTSVAPAGVTATPTDLTNAGFSASVSATIGGVIYSAAADTLLKTVSYTTWLSGPLVNEWLVSAPLKTAQGVAHPHLTARFAIRSYTGLNKAKVDVTIENTWAFEPNPQNFTYDAQVTIGGTPVYTKSALTHYHHARWRKSFWWGTSSPVDIQHNTAYLMASRAVPNYDPTLSIAPAAIAGITFAGPNTDPMKVGLAQPEMPTVGGRPDIGLLPGWTAMYLLSMDLVAKDATLGMGDLGGSWSSHYRDKNTGRPVSVKDYPYMTLLGNPGDTVNPATGQSEAFPPCGGDCATPLIADSAHQPDLAYVPYLVTGDYYYLEELQFWTMFNVFRKNPYYRDFGNGLLIADEVRGAAWSMRTLAEAAYITPDADPLKTQFQSFLNTNLAWFDANFTQSATVNTLGIFIPGASVIEYNNGLAIAPWQDDFFTSAIGRTVELGFTAAKPFLAWKAKFPVSRMTGPGFCWVLGSVYYMNIRATTNSPLYTSIADVYQLGMPPELTSLQCGSASMGNYLQLQPGEMPGYSDSGTGFPSNMQPALAYSAAADISNGQAAWTTFMNRSVKPDYSIAPQFAVVPRN